MEAIHGESMKTLKTPWFEVSTEGLRALQLGKPKHFVVRELIQNAWDEQITSCEVEITRDLATRYCVTVRDDAPEGFKDLADSFTLFKATSKQRNPTQRGRFNFGEKQALAVCEEGTISTTKGTVRFTKAGREISKSCRDHGSEISLLLHMTFVEREELQAMLESYLPPKGIRFTVNGNDIPYREPRQIVTAALQTVIESMGALRTSMRKTAIHVLPKQESARLYEMGIPVCEIECDFDLDVQQKIPLSPDRESVTPAYLAKLYAAVFSEVAKELSTEQAAQTLARTAVEHPHVSPEATQDWVKAVYGEKVVVANPRDQNSIDEAISRGYKVVYGSELPKGVWQNINKAEQELEHAVMPSSTKLFGVQQLANAKPVTPDADMRAVADLAKRIAVRCLKVEIGVSFISSAATISADYGNRHLRFNVKRLPEKFFQPRVDAKILDLLVHELAHEAGGHVDHSYHEAMTKLAGQLVMIALHEPEFFKASA